MTGVAVLERCRVRGIELTVAAGRLRFRAPAGVLDDGLRQVLIAHKAEIIAALSTSCPTCHRPVDGKRRCWPCCDRACEHCGRPTGSAFIAHCWPCQYALEQTGQL